MYTPREVSVKKGDKIEFTFGSFTIDQETPSRKLKGVLEGRVKALRERLCYVMNLKILEIRIKLYFY